MIWQILYVLSFWVYFIGEGATEGLTWWTDRNTLKKLHPQRYHISRIIENLGLIGIILLLTFIKADLSIWIALLAACSGLCLYEFVFCHFSYNDWKHQKTSKWMGIPHPGWQVWMVIFILSSSGLVYLISL